MSPSFKQFSKWFGTKPVVIACSLAASLLFSSCATAPMNKPLTPETQAAADYHMRKSMRDLGDSGLMVVLYFSGGGSRAAGMSYGVLKELAETPVPGSKRMLDQVLAINAVSGGSFPAAYYCLYGDACFTEFEDKFINHNIQGDLSNNLIKPSGMTKLASERMGRSDLAAEYYDRQLFHGATFGDLAKSQSQRPYLIINATNLSNCAPFQFTQDYFDLIGSDLNSFPISRAVAASSAFPILLTPITLQNFADKRPPTQSIWENADPANALFRARQEVVMEISHAYKDTKAHPYIHLSDGGLSDNLGLRGLLNLVAIKGGWSSTLKAMKKHGGKRVAIIVVDAAVQTHQEWNLSPVTPTSSMVLSAMSNSLVNRTSRETLATMQTALNVYRENLSHLPDGGKDEPEIYFIHVSFSQIKDEKERTEYHNIPTRLYFEHQMGPKVVNKARELLREEPEFQRLMKDLSATANN